MPLSRRWKTAFFLLPAVLALPPAALSQPGGGEPRRGRSQGRGGGPTSEERRQAHEKAHEVIRRAASFIEQDQAIAPPPPPEIETPAEQALDTMLEAYVRENSRRFPTALSRILTHHQAASDAATPAVRTAMQEIASRLPEIERRVKAEVDKARAADPEDPDANEAGAALAASLGDPRASLQMADQALKRRENASLHQIRARDLFELGDNREAASAASRSIKLDPDNADAWSTRAAANYKLGDYKQALRDANTAAALDPDDHRSRTIASVVKTKLKLSDEDQGKEQLPSKREAQVTAAAALGGPGGVERAREFSQHLEPVAAGQAPSRRAQSLYKQSLNQLDLGDHEAAHKSASAAIELSPASPEPYAARAAANNYLGRHADAIADATQSLELQPANPVALNARAWAFNQTSRPHEALTDADRALATNPRDAYAFVNRALAEEKLQRWDAMAQDFETALTLDPTLEPEVAAAAVRFEKATGRPFPFKSPHLTGNRIRPRAGQVRGGWTFTAVALVAGLGGGFLLALLLATSKSASEKPDRASSAQTAPGAVIGGCYRLVREIGRGGMGVVYEAEDLSLGRTVALKKMKEELRLRTRDKDRFLQEARTVAGLRHPNIVEIYSVFEDAGDLYLVFEHVPGMTLDEHLYRRSRLDPKEARAILGPICSALSYAHERRVIHRDLKPSNVMLATEGQVKVMDFGLARQAKDTLSALSRTEAAGTPAYMAPEMDTGQVRKESDIFMLGCVVYEMLTGKMPFEGGDFHRQKLKQAYTPASAIADEVPKELDDVLARALAPEPVDRFRTPQEFLEAYDAALRSVSRSRGA